MVAMNKYQALLDDGEYSIDHRRPIRENQTVAEAGDQVVVSSDRKTVWVHALDGGTVGRFSTRFGMDIHTTVRDQIAGQGTCLHCTHAKPDHNDWLAFCKLMERHYSIRVDQTLIDPEWAMRKQ